MRVVRYCGAAIALLVAAFAILIGSIAVLDPPFTSAVSGQFLPPLTAFLIHRKVTAISEALVDALQPPQMKVMWMIHGYQTTHAIGAFAKMQVGEAIEQASVGSPDGWAEVADIAQWCKPQCNVGTLQRLLRYLATMGILASDSKPDSTRFGLTERSRLLLKDVQGSMWGAAMVNSGDHSDAWQNLEASLSGGGETIPFSDRYGQTIWDYYKENAPQGEAFASFMTSFSARTNAAIAATGYNFSAMCETIVDVGGSHGSLLSELISLHPSLAGKVTVLDLPSVIATAPTAEGLRFVSGDFFDGSALPVSDCYVLKTILHDWPDADSKRILENVRTALGRQPDGSQKRGKQKRLFVVETALDQSLAGDMMAALKVSLDMTMMAMNGGRERTVSEWGALLADSGFEVLQFRRTRSPFSLIETRPAQ